MKNKRRYTTKTEQYYYKIEFKAICDVNQFCAMMMGLERFVIAAEVRSGTYIVDAKSLLGVFSLDLTTPVEVWFTVEMDDRLRSMDLDKYFAAKIEKYLVKNAQYDE